MEQLLALRLDGGNPAARGCPWVQVVGPRFREEAMLDEAASVADRLQSDSTLGTGIEAVAAPARRASSRRLRFNAAAPPRVW